MDDASGVGCFEGAGDLNGDCYGGARKQRTLGELLPERAAIDVFGSDEMEPVCAAKLVNGEDVGMIQRGGSASLLLEAPQAARITRQDGHQHFDRDSAPQDGIGREIDLAHSARADGGKDLVMADRFARVDQLGRWIGSQLAGYGKDRLLQDFHWLAGRFEQALDLPA